MSDDAGSPRGDSPGLNDSSPGFGDGAPGLVDSSGLMMDGSLADSSVSPPFGTLLDEEFPGPGPGDQPGSTDSQPGDEGEERGEDSDLDSGPDPAEVLREKTRKPVIDTMRWFLYAPEGKRDKVDMELGDVELGEEPMYMERFHSWGGLSYRVQTLTNVMKYITASMHILNTTEDDVEVLIRPKFPKADKYQLNHVRTLVPEFIDKILEDSEASFEDILETTPIRILLDPIFDKMDLHLARETLVVQLLEAVCCFLPLEKDAENLAKKPVVQQPISQMRWDEWKVVRTKKTILLDLGLESLLVDPEEEKKKKKEEADRAEKAKLITAKKKPSPKGKKAEREARAKAKAEAEAEAARKKAEAERKAADESKRRKETLLDLPNREHESGKYLTDYNQVIQARILPVWRNTKSPEVVLQCCKLCSLLHKIDNRIIAAYLLNCPQSSYAWLALSKLDHFSCRGLEIAAEQLLHGSGKKSGLDRAVAFFVCRHVLRCCGSGEGDYDSLVPLRVAQQLCHGLIFALQKKMKKVYNLKEEEMNGQEPPKDVEPIDNPAENQGLFGGDLGSTVEASSGDNESTLRAATAAASAAQKIQKKLDRDFEVDIACIQTYCCAIFLLFRQSVFEDYEDIKKGGDFVIDLPEPPKDLKFKGTGLLKTKSEILAEELAEKKRLEAEELANRNPKRLTQVPKKGGSPKRDPSPSLGGKSKKELEAKRKADAKKAEDEAREKALDDSIPEFVPYAMQRVHRPFKSRVQHLLEICCSLHAAHIFVPYMHLSCGYSLALCAMLEDGGSDLMMQLLSIGLLEKIIDTFHSESGRPYVISCLCRLTAAIVTQDRRKDLWKSNSRFKKEISPLLWDAIQKYGHALRCVAQFALIALSSLHDNAQICFDAATYVLNTYPEDKLMNISSWICLLNCGSFIYRILLMNKKLGHDNVQKQYLDDGSDEEVSLKDVPNPQGAMNSAKKSDSSPSRSARSGASAKSGKPNGKSASSASGSSTAKAPGRGSAKKKAKASPKTGKKKKEDGNEEYEYDEEGGSSAADLQADKHSKSASSAAGGNAASKHGDSTSAAGSVAGRDRNQDPEPDRPESALTKTNLEGLPKFGETVLPMPKAKPRRKKKEEDRPYMMVDVEEERLDNIHYNTIVSMAQQIVKWLQKDDPFYIEEDVEASRLKCIQLENDGDMPSVIDEMQRMTFLKATLRRERDKQWNPPRIKFKTMMEEYKERVTNAMGAAAEKTSGKKEIHQLFMKYDEKDYHSMYLAICKKYGVAEGDILPRYELPDAAFNQSFVPQPPAVRTVRWEYRNRLVDLYTRFHHFPKARDIDLELLEYRGREHTLYKRRCFEMGEHPLPLFAPTKEELEKEQKCKPELLVDDVEIQFVGLTTLTLLVTFLNRHDISVELRRIGERGLDHPCVLIDLASRSFLDVFNETQRRMDAAERARKHNELVAHYKEMLKKLFSRYDKKRMPLIHTVFEGIPLGQAREPYIKYCKEYYVDPDEFEDASDSDDDSSEEDSEGEGAGDKSDASADDAGGD